jgi:hypothetical protein
LKRIFNHLKSKSKGFKPIETVMVIAIFVLLAAIILIKLTGPAISVQAGQLPIGNIPERGGLQDVNLDSAFKDLQSTNPGIDWQQVQMAANQAACKMELKVLQTAVDTMMIKEGLSDVQATSGTNDMTAFPSGTPLYPRYLRDETTSNKYCCDKTGQVKLAE